NPSPRTIEFEEALHTYFAVSDISAASVSGLSGCEFIDKTAAMQRRRQSGAPVLSDETDSVHLDTSARLEISDTRSRRRIVVEKTGASSAIVWNPWAEKSAAMGDLGPEVWRGMICVETGNVADNTVHLAAESEHVMTTIVSVAEA